jgi:hypothetical protein
VFVLWALGVTVYTIVVFLLTRYQLELLHTRDLANLAAALRDGDQPLVAMYSSDHQQLVYAFPTTVVVQFAVMGLAVIATAWTGRRLLAIALPFVVLVGSLAPAWGAGGLTVTPLGQEDWGFWASLTGAPWVVDGAGFAVWPLVLGSVLQTCFWLLPLIAAPMNKTAPLPAKDVVARATLPSAALAIVVLAIVSAPSGEGIYRAPLVAFGIGVVATALATVSRPAPVRLLIAVAVPAAVVPIAHSNAFEQPAQLWALAGATAACAVLILGLTALVSWIQQRIGSDASTDGVVAALS